MSSTKAGSKDDSFKDHNDRTIFVGNIPFKMTWFMLRDAFNRFGPVQYAKIVFDKKTGQPRGFGFVQFENQGSVAKVLNEPSMEFFGRTLEIRRHDNKPRSPKKILDDGKEEDRQTKSNKPSQVQLKAKKKVVCIFDLLTDNELVIIFTYFSPIEKIRYERVCKRWQRCALAAAKTERHLTILTIFKRFHVFSEDNLIQVIKRCSPNLKTLDISKVCQRFGNRVFALIGLYLPNLLSINISGIKANRKGLRELAQICTHLQILEASDCVKFNDKAFMHVFQLCKGLQTLVCDRNQNITGEFLQHATPKLKHLILRNCRNLQDGGLKHISTNCQNLKSLNLNSCQLSPAALGEALGQQRGLRDLSLGDSSPDPHTGLAHLPHPVSCLVKPSLLTTLELYNSGLYDNSLMTVTDRCTSLHYLDISCNKLSDVSVSQLSNLKLLRTLYACHLQKITDASLVETIKNGSLIKLCVQGCKSLSDKLLEEIAKYNPLMEELDVAGIPEITRRGLESLAKGVGLGKDRKMCVFIPNISVYISNSSVKKDPSAQFLEALNLSTNYRPLYKTRMQWVCLSEEERMSLDNHNEEMRCGGIQLLDRSESGPAELYDSDEDFENFDVSDPMDDCELGFGDDDDDDEFYDEFLDNDDPLEYERFDLS